MGIHWEIDKTAFSQLGDALRTLSYLKRVLTLVDARAPRNWREELLHNRSYSRSIQERVENDYNLKKSIDECAEWVLKSVTEHCTAGSGN